MRLPPGARKLRLTSTRTEPSLGPHTKRIHRAHLLGIFFSPYCTYLVLHERHGPVVELLPPGHKPLTLIFEPKMAGFLRHALYSIASSLPIAAIERIDYTPGSFTSRRGDASIGILELRPRTGSSDLAITGYGASVAGPLAKGTFSTTARMGFFDLISAVARASNPRRRPVGAVWRYMGDST